MKYKLTKLLAEFSRNGVLHREKVKNNLRDLQKLLRAGLVCKVYKRGRVFFELTERALPLLDLQRKKLVEEARMRALVEGRSPFYTSLLEDLRFFDEKKPMARDFLLLGDWQLLRPVVPSQLELAKFRYYQKEGLS